MHRFGNVFHAHGDGVVFLVPQGPFEDDVQVKVRNPRRDGAVAEVESELGGHQRIEVDDLHRPGNGEGDIGFPPGWVRRIGRKVRLVIGSFAVAGHGLENAGRRRFLGRGIANFCLYPGELLRDKARIGDAVGEPVGSGNLEGAAEEVVQKAGGVADCARKEEGGIV